MIDFSNQMRKSMDKVVEKYHLDTDPDYPPKFVVFIKWFGYKFSPAFLTLLAIFATFWIMFRIYNKYGIDRVFIILMLLLILSIRSLESTIKPKSLNN